MEQQLIEHGYERLMPELRDMRLYRKEFGEISVEMTLWDNGEWLCGIDVNSKAFGSLMVTSYTEVQAFITFIKNILKIRQLKARRK